MAFIYEGNKRRAISFPLGGIGSGCIGLSGYGQLVDWEIFNRPNKGSSNGMTHFAVKAEADGEVLDARVLHADIEKDCAGSFSEQNFGHGVPRTALMGLPHFRSSVFRGAFPFAQIDFDDGGAADSFPGKVSLEAFNPFIPTNEDDSSLPAAFFTYTVENTTNRTLTYTLAGSLKNPFSEKGGENRYEQRGGCHVLHLCDRAHAPEDFAYGDLTLATDAGQVDCQEYWFRGVWFDHIGVFWKNFTAPGPLKNRRYEQTAPADDVGTLAARMTLKPGEKRAVRFIISWNLPNNHNYWLEENGGVPYTERDFARENSAFKNAWRNYYATLFADSAATAVYGLENWARLYEGTKLYQEALFGSTLPPEALDAVSSSVSVLKSPTVLRLEDGSLYGWEGCNAATGSCEGSCTHVWAYTYAMCFLFPRLERSMRNLEYEYDYKPDGGLAFRLMLPLGREPWGFRPCADGQFATIFKTYREYKICGDADWLRAKWPRVKRSLEYAWSPENYNAWDPQQTGVLSGRQHHTLDMELFGPNSWLESMYLAALKAGAEMAAVVNDSESEARFRAVFEKGKAWSEEHLFNGEYFFQQIDLTDKEQLLQYNQGDTIVGGNALGAYWSDELGEVKYQVGEGCAMDQVLGQWHANVIGLGEVLDRGKVRSALRSIYRYNYKPSLRGHVNPCRVYGLDDESGTLICAYPEGRREPVIPVPYAQETMHGFEYQAAVHMVQEGMLEEGLDLIRGVRERYDGEKRNPWNEIECGSNYARSMASFALLQAYSGMTFDMGRRCLGFAPVVEGDFTCLWSLDSGFGVVELQGSHAVLRVLYGSLTLERLALTHPGLEGSASVALSGRPVDCRTADGVLAFTEPVRIEAGEALEAVFAGI